MASSAFRSRTNSRRLRSFVVSEAGSREPRAVALELGERCRERRRCGLPARREAARAPAVRSARRRASRRRARRSGSVSQNSTTTSIDAARSAKAKHNAATMHEDEILAASGARLLEFDRGELEARAPELEQRRGEIAPPRRCRPRRARGGVPSVTPRASLPAVHHAGRRGDRRLPRCRSTATDCRARSRRWRGPRPWRGRCASPSYSCSLSLARSSLVSTCERRSRALSPVSVAARFSISSASARTAAISSTSRSRPSSAVLGHGGLLLQTRAQTGAPDNPAPIISFACGA